PPATSLGVKGAGDGPIVTSLEELPATTFTGVVLANELLDNLAFDLLTLAESGWAEIRIGYDPEADALTRHVVPAVPALATAGLRFAPHASIGAVIPLQHQAGKWVRDALRLLERGHLVVIDYGVEHTAELAHRNAD